METDKVTKHKYGRPDRIRNKIFRLIGVTPRG